MALDFPQHPPRSLTSEELETLEPLVDAASSSIGASNVQDIAFSPETSKLLIRFKDDTPVSDLKECIVFPDHLLRAGISGLVKGVILTMKGSKENGAVDSEGTVYDFVSRYFAPWLGIAEDPVTGSAHTVLGPYWSAVLHKNMMYGKNDLPVSHQNTVKW